MLGSPKYKYGDRVKFVYTDIDDRSMETEGYVAIVDPYGTFFQDEEPSYDVYINVAGELILVKHIRESRLSLAL